MPDKNITVFPEVPESLDTALKNITDLPTKSVGQTLSDCWFLAFGGISQLAEKRRIKYMLELDKFKKEVEESLVKVPEEYKKEPSTQIIMKTLEEAKFCVEEEKLRQLFVNLLASSTDMRKQTHPSFAHIISQMSSIDAKVLNLFYPDNTYPICDLFVIINEQKSFQVYAKNIFITGTKKISQDEKAVAISSLVHLGLLEIPEDMHASNEVIYEAFKESDMYLSALCNIPQDRLELKKKIVRLTPLGKSFIDCCLY